jgi:hypothetical protein
MSPSLCGGGRALIASHFLVMRGFKLHGYDRFELLPVSLLAREKGFEFTEESRLSSSLSFLFEQDSKQFPI